jgi:hypothetical protein
MSTPLYPTPEVKLPGEILDAIKTSVYSFREQWGMMASYAISMGYIDKYDKELRRIAELAYVAGIASAKDLHSANAREPQPSETAEKSANPKSE